MQEVSTVDQWVGHLRVLQLIAIVTFAVSSMFAVGLRYKVAELLRPMRDVLGVGLALFANFVLTPLLAIVLLRVVPLEPAYQAGLIVVATAAGAPLLVKLVANAKEDVAFASSILILLLLASIALMPVLVPWLTGSTSVSARSIAVPLLTQMFAPLVLGFALRPLFPSLVPRVLPILGRVATVSLWTMLALVVALNFRIVLSAFGTGALTLSAVFIGIAFLIGYFLGTFDKAERAVLGFSTAQRNFAAAVVVAGESFADANVLVMVVLVSIVAMLLLPLSSSFGRRKEKKDKSVGTHTGLKSDGVSHA